MRKFHFLLPNSRNLFIWFNALIMLIGLLFFGWRPVIILFAYVFETIIVGVIHIFKLWAVYKYGDAQKRQTPSKDPRQMHGFAIIPFFVVHYFFFIFVQSIFIFSLVESDIPGMDRVSFNVFGNYKALLSQPDMLLAFACLALSNVLYTIKDFFMTGRFHQYTTNQLFMQPYLRIFVQQVISIISGFFIILTKGAAVVAALLILLRAVLDLYLSAVKNDEGLKDRLLQKLSKDDKGGQITKKNFDVFLD